MLLNTYPIILKTHFWPLKKTAIRGLGACVSYEGVKALRLSDNPPL